MNIEELDNLSDRESEQFRSVCNKLLSQTFIVKRDINAYKKGINNSDYYFIESHSELIKDYLSYLDWDLHKDINNVYYFVTNAENNNKVQLSKDCTIILLVLRLLYEDKHGELSEYVCQVNEVLEVSVNQLGLYKKKPNMLEFARNMRVLDGFNIIKLIDGSYSQTTASFMLLPTILTAVSAEKVAALVEEYKKEGEDDNEETDEAIAD